MASYHYRVKSGNKGTAAKNSAYIEREGKYEGKKDRVESGSGNMPHWADGDPALFWKTADRYERKNAAVYREHEIALPAELTPEQRSELVISLIQQIAGSKPFQYAVHEPTSSIEGKANPHLHLMLSDRVPDGIPRLPGQEFKRFNRAQPSRGGWKKSTGGKNRLQLRDDLIEQRRRCADMQNAVLAKHGHAARVDHRSYKVRGIDRQPERHLGPARIKRMTPEEKEWYAHERESNSC